MQYFSTNDSIFQKTYPQSKDDFSIFIFRLIFHSKILVYFLWKKYIFSHNFWTDQSDLIIEYSNTFDSRSINIGSVRCFEIFSRIEDLVFIDSSPIFYLSTFLQNISWFQFLKWNENDVYCVSITTLQLIAIKQNAITSTKCEKKTI